MRSRATRCIGMVVLSLVGVIPTLRAADTAADNKPAENTTPAQAPERPRRGARAGAGEFAGGGLAASIEQLGLTEEQKAQMQPVLQELREAIKEARTAEGPDRAQKMRDAMSAAREKMAGILTPEQQEKLRELTQQRQGQGGMAQGGFIGRLKQAVEELNLTDEQKAKVNEIVESYRGQFEAIRKEHAGDAKAIMEAVRPLVAEMRAKVTEVLTPEQAAELKTKLMSGAGERRGIGAKRNAPASEKPATPQ